MGGIVAVWRQGVAWTQQVWPVALAISLAACGSETPTGPSGPSIAGTTVAVTVTCTAEPNGQQCRASAQLSNRTVQDVTASATWTSSNTSVATVDSGGRVTNIASGQAEIRATYEDRFGSTLVMVNLSVLSVAVTCTPETGAHVCTARATLSNGLIQDVTRSGAFWFSSNTNVAAVDSSGRVTHVNNGQVEIAARFGTVTGGVLLTLSGVRTLASVSVACTAGVETHQCAALAHFSDGTTETVTSQATWTSSNTAVAIVDSSGRVRHRISGQVEIRAVYRSLTGSIALEIVVGLTGTSVVINEFALRATDASVDDFVELRNDSASAVHISGWQIREWLASDGSIAVRLTVPQGVVLMPGCHYLAAFNPTVKIGTYTTDVGVARDIKLDNLSTNGGIALFRIDGTIVDQVGMNPSSPFKEGATLPPTMIDDSRSYSRVGNDTNDNASDFVKVTRTAMNSTSCAVR